MVPGGSMPHSKSHFGCTFRFGVLLIRPSHRATSGLDLIIKNNKPMFQVSTLNYIYVTFARSHTEMMLLWSLVWRRITEEAYVSSVNINFDAAYQHVAVHEREPNPQCPCWEACLCEHITRHDVLYTARAITLINILSTRFREPIYSSPHPYPFVRNPAPHSRFAKLTTLYQMLGDSKLLYCRLPKY